MARTLMAYSSGLARTNIMVPTDHSMYHPHRIAETIYLARTMFMVPSLLGPFICLLDLILYIPSTIFQLYRNGSSWVEPVLS